MNVCLPPLRLALLLLVPGFALAAPAVPAPNPELIRSFWSAVWIADGQAPAQEYGVFHFRRAFELRDKPARFLVHVSADNRFQLFVNGAGIARGPARGDPMHWRYETIDLAPHLRAGRNVIAAEVWNAAASKPWAQMAMRTAFLLQGDTEAEHVVNTGPTWKVLHNPAHTPQPVDRAALQTFIVSGDGDRVEGSRYPWGWEQPDFDDHAWRAAVKLADAIPYGVGTGTDWWLVQNRLPPMEETPQPLGQVRRSTGVTVPDGFLAGRAPLHIPPRTEATILLDQTFETNAYPTLTVSGGKGTEITASYAEALVDANRQKGNRNDIEGRRLIGVSDVFLPDGGENRTFSTLWFRTYRYVELRIRTGEMPLTVHGYTAAFTGYPFKETGRFQSNDPRLAKIWEVGWRTARLCAHETYFDCPYYEQLQYVGDTRLQALISLYVAGDDRLMRNAIELYDHSRVAEGLTQSRYPSVQPQIINTFSLFWIDMVHDYWMHREDRAFVADKLPGARNVLEWFERHLDATSGILGPLPYWTFVDWPDEWPWSEENHIGGEPPGARTGGSAIVTLQLSGTLQRAAELFAAHGDPALAGRYRTLAERLNRRTVELCWDASRRMLADTPEKRSFSQHANVMAVLAGAVQGDAARDLITRVAADRTLVQTTYYFRFYLLRAMKQVGLGDQYIAQLGPWHDMLARGLTTFAERQEPTRSDCHAWSSTPCYEFLATVAGIEPAAPGFRAVRITPHLGGLTQVKASVPTPSGNIEARYATTPKGVAAEITLPAGMTGELVWKGRRTPLQSGAQSMVLE